MKKFFAPVLALTLGLGIAGIAQAETWKFATEEAKGDVQAIYAQSFADAMKEESGGDIKVKLYYYGQLGTENDIVELAANGTIQFVAVGTGHLGSYVPEVQVLSLPYVLGTDETVTRKILTGSKTIYDDLSHKFEGVNLKLMSMFSEGEMVWGANKAIRTPEDFANHKIRTLTSTIPVETYKTFGATPTPLSWGEVYGSLQLKTIDGMVNPIYFIYNAKWHEVQSHLIFSGEQPYVGTVAANNKWFNKLSSEKQAMVKSAAAKAEQAAYEYQIRINQENMQHILEEKPSMQVIVLNDEERGRFEKLSQGLHETYYNIVENAHDSSKKAEAREGAKEILRKLTEEIEQAKSQ